MRSRRDHITSYLFILPAVAVFIFFIGYPAAYSIILSLHKWNGYTLKWQGFVGFNNFIEMFQDRIFWLSFSNSFKLLFTRIPVEIILATLLAFMLDYKFKGREVVKGLLFMPVVAPIVVVGIVMSRVFEPNIGLISLILTKLGLPHLIFPWLGDPDTVIFTISAITIWKNVGFSMVILFAGLQNIPIELREASIVDGASETQYSLWVALPLLLKPLGIAVVLASISVFKIFDLVYVLTSGGPAHHSEVIASYMYLEAFQLNNMGIAATASIVLLVIALGLSVLNSKLIPSYELS
ncbi:MAG TPA: sugar ABC transporter permease [Spirochaetia bacterium]|nr:sugar ABC transporter permease [Spirochaetia bacterium]